MTDTRRVLVTGATGQQGGAVARALLDKGHQIRALTRNPASDRAVALRERGAEVFLGSFDDAGTLAAAVDGVDAVFAMSTFFEAGLEAETRQGIALVDAAKKARVSHFVFSSVGSADQKTGIPHFDSKRRIEEHLDRADVPYTVVAPVFFMDNLISPFSLPALKEGNFAQPLPAGRKLQMVAVENIGQFAALAIDKRDPFLCKRVDIASDDLTGADVVTTLNEVTGKSLGYVEVPLDAMRRQSEEMAAMYEWFDKVGYDVDLGALRKTYPEVGWKRFADWAREQDWSVLDA